MSGITAEVWRAYLKRAGQYQTRLWLAFIYVLLVGPTALLRLVFRARSLDLDARRRDSYWHRRQPLDARIETLHRQF